MVFGFARTCATLAAAFGLLVQSAQAHGGDASAFAGAQGNATGQVIVTPETQKALGVVVQPVEEKRLSDDLILTGEVETLPSKSFEVKAPVSGRIVHLEVQRGATVTAGQLVATLDSPEIRSLAVDANRAQAQGQAQLEQARAKVQLAQSSLRRQQTLLTAGISARKDYDVARADLATAQAEYDAAASQIRLSSAALSNRLSSLDQSGTSATRGGTIAIRSPAGGTVIEQPVTSGQAIEAGTTLIKIVDTSSVAVASQVFEKDISKIRVGQAAEATLLSYPGRTFTGSISGIDPIVDPDTRTVQVRETFLNGGGLLKPGMFATVRLITNAGGKAVVAIPRSAILDVDGKQSVFVKNGDAFQLTAVTVGRESGSLVEITDGVFAGDAVVTQRAFQLRAQLLKGPATSATDTHDEAATKSNGPPLWFWSFLGLALLTAAFAGGRFSSGRARSRPFVRPDEQTGAGNGSAARGPSEAAEQPYSR